MSPARTSILVALAVALASAPRGAAAQCPPLDGLGGPAGFGEGVLVRGDDTPSQLVDVGAAFPEGLGFFGATFSDVYININGNLTLGEASATFTPFPFPSDSGVRRIAIFFSDVDTRTDRGLDNNIYYHVDEAGGRLIVTWLAVERFPVDASLGLDTFQMILTARPDLGPGDFDVEYRYQVVDWIAPDGSPPAQIGFDAGDGIAFASHPASMTAAVADLETTPSNHPSDCATGSFAYFIRGSCGNDQVDAEAQEECDPLGSDPGCSSLCTVTPGYACTYVDGQPSACSDGCGDGDFDAAVEECDDGNGAPGDGCSPICRVEPGATCDTSVEPSDCNNTCAVDGDCAGQAFCGDNGRCQPARPDAQVCARDAMCQSGACADGVCCGTACDEGCGTCAASGSVGTCTPVGAGSESAACGGFLCDGTSVACPTSCVGDGDCAADHFCDGQGACLPDQAPGGGCDRVGQCASGVCVDGVCCATGCDGACERCDLEGASGACTPLPGGTVEPACGAFTCDGVSGACPMACAGDDDCVADHFCDGQGACQPDLGAGVACGRDAQCGARVCSAGVCCATACDGACQTCSADPGTCTPLGDGAAVAACGPMLCDGVGGGCPAACAGDGDCAADHFCDGQGACQPDLGAGEPCGRDPVCAAGTACVDGVCCTSACAGACERCDLPGEEGACAPLADGTFVAACGAYACDGASGACPVACAGDADCTADHFCDGAACQPDGAAAAACDRAAQCATGACADGVCCDAACEGACERCDLAGDEGACTPVDDGTFVAGCGAYACDGASGACPTTCDGDGDCAADHFCDGGACAPDVAAGAACERTAQCAAGSCVDDVCCTLPCDGPCGRCGLGGGGACGFFGDGTFVLGCGAYACDGGAAACPTTCGGDEDCAADHFCDGGACVPDRDQGDGCERGAQCPTGLCADGVCCDGACDGACEACDLAGSEGACSPVADGESDPRCEGVLCDGQTRACPTTCEGDGDCTFSHYCDEGVCALDEPPGGACDREAQCGEGHCVDAVCCLSACDGPCDRCDGATPGTCAPIADGTFVAACGAYACDGVGGACPATCAGDGDCAADHFCEGGVCLPDRAPGGDCDRVGQCATGRCADGVCCDSPCDGGCDRCDLAGALGTCGAVADGAAGQGCGPYLCGGVAACPTTCSGDVDCAGDHFCEAGVCLPDRATGQSCDRVGQCASGHCADGVCCGAACDGACDRCDTTPGACLPVPDGTLVAACDPYLCGGGAGCPATCASDADCAEDHFCDTGGACAPDAAPGIACDDGAMCATGTCSDGVCCDWPCEGACERCDLEGAPGTCTLLADGALVAACGAYACDGASGTCPAACTSDADCAGDHFCDGQGACQKDQANGLACDRKTQCLSGACADGLCCTTSCEGGCDRCDLEATAGTCTNVADGTAARECGAYLCDGGAACPTACLGDGDCDSGHVCEGQACVPLAADGAACTRDAACTSGACVGGLCCDGACEGPCEACDLEGLEGQCVPREVGALVEACGDYRCDGQDGVCPTACEIDGQCAAGTWCGDEACHPAQVDDSACARDAQCASGFCSGGRCITLAIDQPLDGAITNDATPEVRGRAPRGSTVVITVGGSTFEVTAGEDGVWVFVPEAPLPEGPITIGASFGEAEVEVDLTVDTVAPAITIQSPLAGTIRPEPSLTVSGVTEPDLHVAVTLGALGRETDASAAGAWSMGFDGLVDGPHTVSATATDRAGNVGEASVSFTVDSLAPTVEITEPAAGALTNVAEVTVRGRGKPSSTLTLLHDGATFTGAVDGDGDWSIALGVVADGTWTDLVTITDQAERQANDEVTYTIDTTPPALAVTSPEEDARIVDPKAAVTGTSEPGATLEVRLDGEVIATIEVGADGAWTATPPQDLVEGDHTVAVSARDAAGNTTEVTRGFTLGGGEIHLVGGSSCAVGGGGLLAAALALAALALSRRLRRGARR